MIDYQKLRSWQFADVKRTYTQKDTMLYALGIGLGADPLDEKQLRFVYEKDLAAVPTMAAVLGSPGFWARDPDLNMQWQKVVHGEQSLVVHEPLPASATVVGRNRITRVVDKGKEKGAVVHIERELTDEETGRRLATLEQVWVCRGDGGFSDSGQPTDEAALPVPAPPKTSPERSCELTTRPEAALIYRLSGDGNPLHADPAAARAVGFEKPILHGLATYGIACHSVLRTFCDYVPSRLRSIKARFSAPVYPGDTICFEFWRVGEEIAFRAHVPDRAVVVLSAGRALCT